MEVYILQVTQDSDSAYNAFEWVNKGVFLREIDARLVGEAHVRSNPDEEYSVDPVTVIEEVGFS